MKRTLVCAGLFAAIALAGCASNPAQAERDARPRCEIHGQILSEKTVPVSYGLPDDFYVEQRYARFPHVREAFGGCIIPALRETRRVQVCSDCEVARRDFERNWRAEWDAHLQSFDENTREPGETLAEAERSEDADERANERTSDRLAGRSPGNPREPGETLSEAQATTPGDR